MRKELISMLAVTALSAVSASGDTITATFNYGLADLAITYREGGGDTYQFISMDGEAEITTPGAPALPVVKAALIVPWGSSVGSISVADTASEELEGDYLVYPAQESVFTSNGDGGDWTPPDPAIYGSSDPYPGDVVAPGAPATCRGHLVYFFDIMPVQYRPADEKIDLYTEITVSLDYTLPPDPPTASRFEWRSFYNDWSRNLGLTVANSDDIEEFREPVIWVDVTRTVEIEYGGETIEALEEAPSQYFEYSSPPDDDTDSAPYQQYYPYGYLIITNNYWRSDGANYPVGNLDRQLEGTGELPKAIGKLKKRKGYGVTVRTVDWIKEHYAGGDVQKKIQAFLHAAYKWWGTGYVLLAGDVEKPINYTEPPGRTWRRSGRYGVVPIRHLSPINNVDPEQMDGVTEKSPGDIYYSCVDDWDLAHWDGNNNGVYGQLSEMPTFGYDLHVGRLAFGVKGDADTTAAEVQAYSDKLFAYETDPFHNQVPPPGYSYLRKAHFVAGESWGYQLCEEIKKYIEDQGFPVTDTTYEEGLPEVWDYPRRPEPHEVIEKMNLNYGITFFDCHGNPVCFYLPTHEEDGGHGYVVNDRPYIQAIPTKKYINLRYMGFIPFPVGLKDLTCVPGVLYAMSCDTNHFDHDADCVSEVYDFMPDSGGICLLGNTRHGWSESCKPLAKRFFDLIFDVATQNPNDGIPNLGVAEALSKQVYASSSQESYRHMAYTHDLQGEPECPVYTDEPHIFNVSYDAFEVEENDYLVHVSVRDGSNPTHPLVPYARVCLWVRDQTIHLVGETGSQGDIWFHITQPSSPGFTWLTISRYCDTVPQYPFITHVSSHGIPE
jgi:hypothetical protein